MVYVWHIRAVIIWVFDSIFVIIIIKGTLSLLVNLLENINNLTSWCEFGDDAGDVICLSSGENSLFGEDVELCYWPHFFSCSGKCTKVTCSQIIGTVSCICGELCLSELGTFASFAGFGTTLDSGKIIKIKHTSLVRWD